MRLKGGGGGGHQYHSRAKGGGGFILLLFFMDPAQIFVPDGQIIVDILPDVLPVQELIREPRELGTCWLREDGPADINVPWDPGEKLLDRDQRALDLDSDWLVQRREVKRVRRISQARRDVKRKGQDRRWGGRGHILENDGAATNCELSSDYLLGSC